MTNTEIEYTPEEQRENREGLRRLREYSRNGDVTRTHQFARSLGVSSETYRKYVGQAVRHSQQRTP